MSTYNDNNKSLIISFWFSCKPTTEYFLEAIFFSEQVPKCGKTCDMEFVMGIIFQSFRNWLPDNNNDTLREKTSGTTFLVHDQKTMAVNNMVSKWARQHQIITHEQILVACLCSASQGGETVFKG